MAKWNQVTEETVSKMRELRARGLSNVQIAKELGIKSTTTIVNHIGHQSDNRFAPNKISMQDISKMQVLRSQGLSNSQIAREMSIDPGTVRYHIGIQPTGNRAEYGSVISHVTGDTYAKHPPVKKEPAIRMTESVFRFRGKNDVEYRVDSAGRVRIIRSNGDHVDISANANEFFTFLNELSELGEFILKLPGMSTARKSEL